MSKHTAANSPFQHSLSLLQVKLFIDKLAHDSQLSDKLNNEQLLAADDIVYFASANGFHFSRSTLYEYLDFLVSSRLPADECIQRAQWSSSLVTPLSTSDHQPKLIRALNLTHAQRFKVYRGDVLIFSKLHSFNLLRSFLEDTIKDELQIDDLSRTHELLSKDVFLARVQRAYEKVKNSSAIPFFISSILSELHLDPETVLWEWPSFRIFFPTDIMNRGLYRGKPTWDLNPHRDTWYGSPQHQINFWAPISRLEPDQSLHIYPSYFYEKISNTSFLRDIWLHRVGFSTVPILQQTISIADSICPSLSVGETLCFSGHQIHSSPRPSKLLTRASLEFRICCQNDIGLAQIPRNLDYEGHGEIYTNWFNSSGVETNYYSNKPLSKLETTK